MPLTAPPSAPPPAPAPPGDAPSRANPTTFRSLADAFVVWLVGFRSDLATLRTWLAGYITWAGTHVTEMDALQSDVTTKQTAAATSASSANTSASAASTSASSAGTSASAAATSASSAGSSASAASSSATAAASSAVSAAASDASAQAGATQAQLLAGVSSTFDTLASLTAAASGLAANAVVLVLADEGRQGQTSIYKKLSGVMTYQGVVQYYGATTSSIGDVDPEGTIYIFPGDSTTEQGGANGFLFDTLTVEYRSTGGALQRIGGTINFGGSGHKLIDWVTGAQGSLPTYSTSNLGVNQNDYFGHKATGAYTLATELAWRANLAAGTKVVWLPCYGINDCILDASVGNLSQQGITDYIAGYLRQAVRRILGAFPKDKIILRIPNPMTARPYNPGAGFPSSTQYPTFGSVDATDQALVEKWNQGIRNGYLAVRNEFPGVSVYDKWELVYGRSDTTKTATTQLPFLGDLVHPSGSGYQQEAHQLVALIAPAARVKRRQLNGRHAWAVAQAAADGVNPWEKLPPYLDNNYRFQFIIEGVLNARGSTFLDVTLKTSEFIRLAAGRGIYVQIGEAAAQFFATYTTTDLGGTDTIVRFTSVTPSAAMQAAPVGLPVRIYIDPTKKLTLSAAMDHVQNARCFIRPAEPFPSGGTFSASTGIAVATTVTIDVYQISSNTRTLLGTISIGANAINGTLSTGNPTSTAAGVIYEGKLTSVTSANAIVSLVFTPA